MYLRQQLRTENDVNGNPRRVWVLYRAETPTDPAPRAKGLGYARVVDAVDEGYAGDPALSDDPSLVLFGHSVELQAIDVSVSEYRRAVKWGQRY